MKKILIGDVHGKIDEYKKIIKYADSLNLETIQLGDFGFKEHHEFLLKNIDYNKHKVLFGNHDDYTYLNKPHSLGNFFNAENYMAFRGANSIDKLFRVENVSWWRNEELSYNEMQIAIEQYEIHKPKIMLSHDCPKSISKILFNIDDSSSTTNVLQIMFELYKPKIWVFAHHHKSKNVLIDGTRFICLKELEKLVLDF